jgi:hypothetical protein
MTNGYDSDEPTPSFMRIIRQRLVSDQLTIRRSIKCKHKSESNFENGFSQAKKLKQSLDRL